MSVLSVWDSRLAACVHTTTRKVQELDRSRLEAIAGLLVQPDGDDSFRHHHFLVGNPESLHLEWARSRPTAEESPHRLTEAALGAITERNVSCPRVDAFRTYAAHTLAGYGRAVLDSRYLIRRPTWNAGR